MKYGYVGFCRDEDKMFHALLKESNNIDFLGLRKMNVRLSNIMFPFANTLMPNLVYFYYLHAIYFAVIGDTPDQDNKTLTREQIERINGMEKAISEAVRNIEEAKGKGFFGDVATRAYEKYKNSMKLLHFFDEEWIPSMSDNQMEKWREERKTQHQYLTETDRYRFVKDVVDQNKSEEEIQKEINRLLDNKEENGWLWKIDRTEKLDFIRRVVDPYGPKKGTITRYSVFSNIVMHLCGIGNQPKGWNHTVYRDDFSFPELTDYKSGIDSVSFGQLGNFLEKIEKGFGNTYSLVRQEPVYEVALEYAKLQMIAKLAYNKCLFDKNPELCREYKDKLTEEIKEYNQSFLAENTKIRPEDKTDYARVFFNENDEGLRDAFRFVKKLQEVMKPHKDMEEIRDEDMEEIIEAIEEIVKERELDVLGGNSRLESGIAFDAMGNYQDTFRWEYRPEIAKMEAKENGFEDTDENEGKKKPEDSGTTTRNMNMCARYYIYELFKEK